jgi:tRNA1(Val) A37 N6-methylase TrmN6
MPEEYIGDENIVGLIEEIICKYKESGLNRDTALFSLALNLLQNKGLVNSDFVGKTSAVQKEIDWWICRTQNIKENDNLKKFIGVEIPDVNDILGVIYQSLIAEGSKAENGSYYTPKKVVSEIVDSYVKKNDLVLDPCCGTGQFLLSVAEKVKDPSKIWGFDIDEIAVRLARLNLLLHFSDVDFEPHIYHKNSLTDLFQDEMPTFDLVITNPPWGAHFSREQIVELQTLFPEIKSGEIFSYFIQRGLNLLKDGGVLSFILPEAILNIKTHRDIREILVKKTTIKKIKHLNRVFKNVFTSVIRLDVVKKVPHSQSLLIAEKDDTEHSLEQTRLQNNTDYILNIFADNADVALFDKVYGVKHTTLKGKADWALGVVTGDNKKHLSQIKTKTNEAILTGKDIKKFLAVPASNYIDFNPEKFQQVAPEHKYRAKEKLLYKFISKELVFSYDDKQTLSLNSANVLIPKIENYPIKTILAFLNSSLYQFLYQKKFGAIKILRGDIEQLPLPIMDKGKHKKIEEAVCKLLDDSKKTAVRKKIFDELDDLIMNVFDLKKNEKTYIKKSIKVSDKLLNNKE